MWRAPLLVAWNNLGNVYAQTAAEETRFTFRHVPNPYEIKAKIMEYHQKAEREELTAVREILES